MPSHANTVSKLAALGLCLILAGAAQAQVTITRQSSGGGGVGGMNTAGSNGTSAAFGNLVAGAGGAAAARAVLGAMGTDGSSATSAALQALATAAGTANLNLLGPLTGTYNGAGVYPASQTRGWAITNNFENVGISEVDFWNLSQSSTNNNWPPPRIR